MENRISLTKNTQSQHWSVEGDYYVNMLHSNPLAGNDDAVHRLPEIQFSQVSQNIGDTDWQYGIDINYVNFTRAGPGYDELSTSTVNGNTVRGIATNCTPDRYDIDPNCHPVYSGSYDPSKDLIRTGQRLDIQPSLSRAFRPVDGLDITPKISYRETDYQFNVDQDPYNTRRYIRAELDNRMIFSAVYGDTDDPKATRYKHEIIPEITYTKIPWLEHRAHPFFGSGESESPSSSSTNLSDGDLSSPYGIQFDYNDRVYDRDLVTFALTNKLVEKRWVNDRPEYRQIAAFTLAQSYDAYQAGHGGVDAQPWSDVAGILDVRLDHFQTYSTFNYYPNQNVTNTSARLRFLNDRNQFLQLGLTKQYTIVPGQDVDTRHRIEDYTFSSGFVSKYINLMGRLVYNANWANSDTPGATNPKIKSWAYIAQFKPPGDCWLITFIQDQITGGDTNLRLNFEFTFDGVPKPPLAPEALDAFGF
jgi:LPS-assembly protein